MEESGGNAREMERFLRKKSLRGYECYVGRICGL